MGATVLASRQVPSGGGEIEILEGQGTIQLTNAHLNKTLILPANTSITEIIATDVVGEGYMKFINLSQGSIDFGRYASIPENEYEAFSFDPYTTWFVTSFTSNTEEGVYGYLVYFPMGQNGSQGPQGPQGQQGTDGSVTFTGFRRSQIYSTASTISVGTYTIKVIQLDNKNGNSNEWQVFPSTSYISDSLIINCPISSVPFLPLKIAERTYPPSSESDGGFITNSNFLWFNKTTGKLYFKNSLTINSDWWYQFAYKG